MFVINGLWYIYLPLQNNPSDLTRLRELMNNIIFNVPTNIEIEKYNYFICSKHRIMSFKGLRNKLPPKIS